MKHVFTVVMIAAVFVLIGAYLKVNVVDLTGAVSASMTGVVPSPDVTPTTALKSSTLFAVWALLVLSVTIFFFLRIMRLGA